MNHESVVAQLDDYVDDRLDAAARVRVEEHLDTCASCREELAALRGLLAEARDLPRSIEPPRDLWPDIEGRTRAQGWRARSIWSMRYPLAAAAIVLMAASAAVTAWLVQDGGEDGPMTSAGRETAIAGQPAALVVWRESEQAYREAIGELLQVLEVRSEELDPAVAQLIERNLRVIDRAIEESRAALAADPTNRAIMEALSASYQVKIETLQRLSRLTTQL